jgi:hypothetical protein
MTRLISELLGLAQEVFPFRTGQSVIVEISASPFTPVIEEADIVVLLLQRLDLLLDEIVEHHEIIGNVLRNIEIHYGPPCPAYFLVSGFKDNGHEHRFNLRRRVNLRIKEKRLCAANTSIGSSPAKFLLLND